MILFFQRGASLTDQVGAACDEGEGKSSNWVSDPNYWWIQHLIFESTVPSELPPRPPRAFFGRNELVDQIVDLAETLTPLALIGVGGIGKTSIALTVLHNDRIKQRFGDDRRFIRCDQFPTSLSNFLHRLSAATGAGVENPEDLASLQPFLSSKEILIVLDNAESILDPEGTDSQEIYDVVEELSRFANICLFITSRISTIPPDCETIEIPALSMDPARDIFHDIHKKAKRSDVVDDILEQLDFHPLSITLLATVAHQHKWDTSRLTKEWERRRTSVLQTDHKKSLAATIELSLSSPMFQGLGPDARALLEVVAFFPQGVNEDNLDWLFPTVSNIESVFDKFTILSLTYRNNGFATMLAPLRDHLYPKDPTSSPLLYATKERYFGRLSVGTGPERPNRGETQWIASEDMNVEHALDVFSSIDTDSNSAWEACADFLQHLHWHTQRPIALGSRIEGPPDDRPSKLWCLGQLARMLDPLGDHSQTRRLLTCTIKFWRERGNDHQVATILKFLAAVNMRLRLHAEGTSRVKETLGIYANLDDVAAQVDCLHGLAFLFVHDNQADPAEEAASRAINLPSDGLSQSQLYEHHHILGHIFHCRGETGAAIDHHMKALEIAASLPLHDRRTGILSCLAELLLDEGRFNDAQVHLEQLKLHAVNNPLHLGTAMVVQGSIWYHRGKLEEARSEASRAIDLYEKIGIFANRAGDLEKLIQRVEEEMNKGTAFD